MLFRRHSHQLEKLLAPEESVIYAAKLHPLNGVIWLMAALAGFFAAWKITFWFAIPSLLLLIIYLVPFFSNEFLVTTHRLLIRYGRFNLALNDIDPQHLDHYQLHQNVLDVWMFTGTLILNLKSSGGLHRIYLRYIWNPLKFVEALCTLNPILRGK